jgi:hypothetical protein
VELLLKPILKSNQTTISRLFIEDEPECFILEDVDRGLDSMTAEEIAEKKVYGKTAIPAGRYEVVITWSNRFKRLLPLLLNVKGFEGIRMHVGNYAANTDGCLLPGTGVTKDMVVNSVRAFEALNAKLTEAVKKEKVFITIKR